MGIVQHPSPLPINMPGDLVPGVVELDHIIVATTRQRKAPAATKATNKLGDYLIAAVVKQANAVCRAVLGGVPDLRSTAAIMR